jgi:hypothetical protein
MSVTSAVRRHFVFPLLSLVLFPLLLTPCGATIAISTDLPAMVRKADIVFTGKVLSQRAEWTNRNGRKSIVTLVSFEVLDVHKGTAGAKLELRCPGGTIGETTLQLVGMPSFEEDERCVLFVRTNANAVCPIVGIYHGKLLLQRNGSGHDETLLRHNGRPLIQISGIGKDDEAPVAAGTLEKNATKTADRGHVTLSELKARIREEVATATAASEGK